MWYPELASCQSGLRHLVRDDVVFQWSVAMTEQMEATKRLLCGDVYVQPYDTMLVPTILVLVRHHTECWGRHDVA